jgi:ubiquinone/menaquinone biosynthesis C-methylase UbiE
MKYPPNDYYQKNLDKYYQYGKARINRSLRYFHRQRLDAIFTIMNNIPFNEQESLIVLDAGCGRGANIIQFAKQGIMVIGVDISEEALEQASSWVKQEFVQDWVTLIRGDITALPFKDDSFDVIISSDVLSVAGDTERGINIIAKLLKINGISIIVFPNQFSVFWINVFIIQKIANLLGIKIPGNEFERYRYGVIKSLVNKAGLKIKRTSSVYIIPMLHFSTYNKIEGKLSSKFPFKYLGSHIIIEATNSD